MNFSPSRKLLLVDDHKMIIDGIKLLLRPRSYNILVAYNLPDAIEMATTEKPDLAIVDFRLGIKTGDMSQCFHVIHQLFIIQVNPFLGFNGPF
jgi:CheY-like chemotaxis protein